MILVILTLAFFAFLFWKAISEHNAKLEVIRRTPAPSPQAEACAGAALAARSGEPKAKSGVSPTERKRATKGSDGEALRAGTPKRKRK